MKISFASCLLALPVSTSRVAVWSLCGQSYKPREVANRLNGQTRKWNGNRSLMYRLMLNTLHKLHRKQWDLGISIFMKCLWTKKHTKKFKGFFIKNALMYRSTNKQSICIRWDLEGKNSSTFYHFSTCTGLLVVGGTKSV